ncbi:MAG: hypothetical protein VKS61_15455 [Candidatus Sericytochromatia bacterium]|nr:hypothetical protein [Candidatus Sericytochromatia bacterium]
MSARLVVVDLDLTVYSLAEFLGAHRFAPLKWGNALCRWSPEACDRTIDEVWRSVEAEIAERISTFEALASREARDILWLTAYPLTATKLASFSPTQRTASSFPRSKVTWARAQGLSSAEAVIGDRRSDARLALHLGASFAGYPVWHPAQRLRGAAYTSALRVLWPDGAGHDARARQQPSAVLPHQGPAEDSLAP